MNQSARFLLPAMYVAMLPITLLMFPGPASAACYYATDILAFPQIGVLGNGSAYTEVDAAGFQWDGEIDITCGIFGRVKSWALWPKVHVEGLGSLSFYEYRASDDYAFGKRPKNVHASPGRIFPNVFVKSYAVHACNLHADSMRADGITDPVIFSKDHFIALEYQAHKEVEVVNTRKIIGEASQIRFSEIICRKRDIGPFTDHDEFAADADLDLLKARLILFPSSFEGVCPQLMSLFVRVDSSMTGSVQVWIESTAGWTSDVGVVETSEFDQGSGGWFGELDEQLAVPILLPAPPHPGQVVPPSPTGDLILPSDDPGVNDPPPGPDWTPGVSIEGPAGSVNAASLRLFARFGEQTINSEWQSYSYTCDPKSAIDLPTDDLIVPDEAPPEGVTADDLTGDYHDEE